MPEQYFIRRGKTVRGPFSPDDVKKRVTAGRIRDFDRISAARTGPWKRISEIPALAPDSGSQNPINFDAAADQESAGKAVDLSFRVRKPFFGRPLKVIYTCHNCDAELVNPLSKAGQTDSCAVCGAEHRVPGESALEEHLQAEQDRKDERRRRWRARRQAAAEAKSEPSSWEHDTPLTFRRLIRSPVALVAVAFCGWIVFRFGYLLYDTLVVSGTTEAIAETGSQVTWDGFWKWTMIIGYMMIFCPLFCWLFYAALLFMPESENDPSGSPLALDIVKFFLAISGLGVVLVFISFLVWYLPNNPGVLFGW